MSTSKDAKRCPSCQEAKDASEFYKNRSAPGGLSYYCKQCQKKSSKAWSEANPHYAKQWRTSNEDRVRERRKQYTSKVREQVARWRKDNPAAARATKQRRRAALNGAFTSSTIKDDIRLVRDLFHRCLKCGSDENLQLDHVVPISIGGDNAYWNFQILCRSCNSSKGNRSSADYRPTWFQMLL